MTRVLREVAIAGVHQYDAGRSFRNGFRLNCGSSARRGACADAGISLGDVDGGDL